MNRFFYAGKIFGTITIIKDLPDLEINGRRIRIVEGRCTCGTVKVYRVYNLINQKSCGCLTQLILENHGKTHGLAGTRIYGIWNNMKNRCYNDKVDSYKSHGAKGIIVCPEWLEGFESFYLWSIKNGYADSLSLDRWPKKTGNYCPENCRWATPLQQANNKTTNVLYNYKGRKITLTEICREVGLPYKTVFARVKYLGWSIKKSIKPTH